MSRKAKPRCPYCGRELRWMDAIDMLTEAGHLRPHERRRLIRRALKAEKEVRTRLPRPWKAQEAPPLPPKPDSSSSSGRPEMPSTGSKPS